MDAAADTTAVLDVVRTFFDAFTTGPGVAERLEALRALCVPDAVIVRTCGGEPLVYDVVGFIEPRRALLDGGALTDFREWPEQTRVDVFGDVAAVVTTYAKAGTQDGVAFTGRGMKSLQLVRTSEGWRISAAAWDDERPGFDVEDAAARASLG